MRHKLTSFILKNPPKKNRKARTGSTEAAKENGDEEPSGSPTGEEDADELTLRLQSEAADLAPVEQTAIANDDWSADTDPAAFAKRVHALSLDDNSDEDKGDDPMEQLRLWIEINRDEATPATVMTKIEELGIREKHKTVQIVVESVFTSKMLSGKELEKFNPLLKQVRQFDFYAVICSNQTLSACQPCGNKGEAPESFARRNGALGWSELSGTGRKGSSHPHGVVPSRYLDGRSG